MENSLNYNLEIAKPGDAESIFELLKKTWVTTYPRQHEDPKYNITVEDIEKNRFKNPEESIQKSKQELLNPGDHRTWVVRNSWGQIVGMCAVYNVLENKRIRAIYVDPEFHGKNLGRMLLSEAINYLGQDSKIYLTVATYNEHAIGFYEKFGFKFNRNMPEEDRFIPGKVIPELEMIRN